MEGQPLISRGEVQAMLFGIADINRNVERIVRPLEEALEEGPEADS
jgi:hypothetical protein